MKIQTKILFWYILAFIVLIGSYIAAIVTMMSESVLTNAEELIRGEAEETAQEIYIEDDGPYYVDEDESFRYTHDNVIFVILDGSQLAFGSVPAAVLENQPLELYQIQTVDDASGTQWLIYDLPLNGSYHLRSFYSLSASTQTMQQLVWMMIIAAPFLIILASLGGYFIIKKSFRPITAITATAETIKNNQTYNLRVSYQDTHDEVAQLAGMINGMLDQMEKAIEREREFSANVSHELRTPLTVLRAQAEYILAKTNQSDVIHDVQAMMQQLTSMERLVSQFLELSRVRHIHDTDLEVVDLGHLLDTVVQAFQGPADEKQITLAYEKPSVDIPCLSNETALLRVFHNVVSNAIKYNHPNGHVRIRLQPLQDEYQIEISDTGIGMTPDELSKAFDSFYRADCARTQGDGLGVGLTLTKELVTLLGGTIHLTSVLHEGTTVILTLPKKMK